MITYSQSYTVAAANLTGFASNVTGAAFAITTNSVGDNMQHLVTIRNDSATDHSAKTVTLVGTDANGNSQSETLNAPAGSATVTSTKEFRTLTSATPSASIGADTFDIGWTAVASGPWVEVTMQDGKPTVGVITGGTINYDVELNLGGTTLGAASCFKSANMTAKTAKAYEMLTGVVTSVRLHVNSHTSGTATFQVVQGKV